LPKLAVAFVVREKFGWALAALRRLYAHTAEPFRLYFVDPGYPPQVLKEIDALLAGRDVVRIKLPGFALPNEQINAVLPRVSEPWLALFKNDTLVGPRWLELMRESCARHQAAVAFPMLQETRDGEVIMHRDLMTRMVFTDVGGRLDVLRLAKPGELPIDADGVHPVHLIETHGLLFRTDVAKALWPLPLISARNHLDISIHLWRRGVTVVHDPRVVMTSVFPPIRDYDLDFFRQRWDQHTAYESHVYIHRRWAVIKVPNALPFIRDHVEYAEAGKVQAAYDSPSERDVYEHAVPAEAAA
jgi:hypothetical protein